MTNLNFRFQSRGYAAFASRDVVCTAQLFYFH